MIYTLEKSVCFRASITVSFSSPTVTHWSVKTVSTIRPISVM